MFDDFDTQITCEEYYSDYGDAFGSEAEQYSEWIAAQEADAVKSLVELVEPYDEDVPF